MNSYKTEDRSKTPVPQNIDSADLRKNEENMSHDSSDKIENWHDIETRLIAEIPSGKNKDWELKHMQHVNFAERKFGMYQKQCMNVNLDYLEKCKEQKNFNAKDALATYCKPLYFSKVEFCIGILQGV